MPLELQFSVIQVVHEFMTHYVHTVFSPENFLTILGGMAWVESWCRSRGGKKGMKKGKKEKNTVRADRSFDLELKMKGYWPDTPKWPGEKH